MERFQKESVKRIRRHSHGVLQELLIKGFKDETPGFNQTRPRGHQGQKTTTPTYHHSLDDIMTRKGSLVHLNGNTAVEIYKQLTKPSQSVTGEQLSDIYLPAITGKMSNLQTARAKLSHSCPYLCTVRRRGSASSINSQRAPDFSSKQSYLKAQKESKKSNVTVTMTYLGQGIPGNAADEMKVLQQICGGENICVFKGFVQPGEQFQFTSQRHLGFPFSATFFVKGMMAGRISSCCEYRYAPGFQQGRSSCFRLTRLNGGKPCYKCVNSRHGIGVPAINSSAPTFQRAINSTEGEEVCSSPLFMPLGMEKSTQNMGELSKGGVLSTDSEEMSGSVKDRQRRRRRRRQRSQQADGKGSEEGSTHKDKHDAKPASSTLKQQLTANELVPDTNNVVAASKTKAPDSLQDGKTLNKQNEEKTLEPPKLNGKSRNGARLRDFYEECVEMSTGLESGLDQQRWFKANKAERNRIKEQLTSRPSAIGSASEVELSEFSDSSGPHAEARKPQINKQGTENNTSEKEQDLQKQMDAMTDVLSSSDEVEQLILRNTGLTDDLLKNLAAALKESPSEVMVINLNLNQIGPPGVHVLLDLLQAKSQIKELLLFGNRLGDLGVQTLLSGLAELQDRTAALCGSSEELHFSAVSVAIKELDLGGNGIGSDGLRVLATFMRYHSKLQYLGLAQTSCSDMEAWMALFESVKVNSELTHIILDESNLGDHGVKLFAESLRANEALRKVDLDNNGIGEIGGNYLLEVLASRRKCSLQHLSLEGNYISTTLMAKIQQEVKSDEAAPV